METYVGNVKLVWCPKGDLRVSEFSLYIDKSAGSSQTRSFVFQVWANVTTRQPRDYVQQRSMQVRGGRTGHSEVRPAKLPRTTVSVRRIPTSRNAFHLNSFY
jgi:hypothetical protein